MSAFTIGTITPDKSAIVRPFPAKASISAGQAVNAGGKVVDIDDPTESNIIGLSVTGASDGGQVVTVLEGPVTVSNTLTPYRQIVVGSSGQLKYDSDLVTGEYFVIVGFTISANKIFVKPKNTEVLVA